VRPVDRRTFVLGALSSGLLAACGGSDGPPGTVGTAPSPGFPAGTPLPEGRSLAALPRLANRSAAAGVFDAEIVAAPTSIAYLGTAQTAALGYNDASPGPTIEVTEGDRVRIDFANAIPGQPSTIHWHGLPVPPEQDGNPMDPVGSGARRVYEFSLPDGCAGTYWYHPHPHQLTAEQVARGLAGALIVRPRSDPLPAGLEEHVLMVTDLRLDASAQMTGFTLDDMMNGRMGTDVLVNGRRNPTLATAPGATLRLRILNATSARYLRLAFDDLAMTLIGTDGGLLAAPVPIAELLLAPAERAEVVVQVPAAGLAGTPLRLLPYDRGWMTGPMPALTQSALLTLRAQGAARTPAALPATLRPIAPLPVPVALKRLELTELTGPMMGMGMMSGGHGMTGWQFLINGRTFDMNRIDLVSRAGDVEQWEIANLSRMEHPIHVHGTQFQVVERERGGVRAPAPFPAWKDTVNVGRGETVRLRVRQDLRGLRMFHCHILEHESQGMMGVLQVQ
jgi:bilirubin oxidase